MSEPQSSSAGAEVGEISWRSLFEKLQEGFFIAEMVRDPHGRVIDWRFIEMNEAWELGSGLLRAAARGRTVREVIPGIEPVWIENFGRVADTGQPASFSQAVHDLKRNYDVRAFPVSAQRIAVLFVEVSARDRANARRNALLELSDRIRELQDPDDIAYATAEVLGLTLGVSRAGYGAVDVRRETIAIARDWNAPGIKSLAGELRFREYGSHIEDLKRGQTAVVVNAYEDPRTRDMAERLKTISAVSFVNMPVSEHGGIVALLYLNNAVAREWTDEELEFIRDAAERTRQAVERRRAEQSLRALAASLEQMVKTRTEALERAQARLRAIFETSYQLQGVLDVDGTLIDANATSLKVIGATLDEVVGRPLWQTPWFAGTRGMPEKVRTAVQAAARGTPSRLEVSINLPAGLRSYDFSLRPIRDNSGAVVSIVPEAVDITQRQRAEEQLRQAQKMEAVGQLTGGLAHDFNNLLTGISGSLEMLQTRLAQGKFSAIERYANAAHGAAKRAAALTHRLLAFSRRQTLDPKSTDVNRLVADMEEMIRRTVGPAIQLEVIGAGGLWRTLIDRNQLENSLLNLCINSRDAMPNGGRITIETANTWLDERAARDRDLAPGQYVSLSVTDTGTGMTPEVTSRAFDPFFTTKPLGEGTGLGLSMVYGFARQSGGQVRIYTEIGQGTTVCLYLPRDRAQLQPDSPRADDPELDRNGDGEVVLVVDDEPTIRMLVTEVLADAGYAAIEAGDGPEGLKLLQSPAKVDLLITDVGLPGGINGRQLADAARALRPDLKVLFITGYAENAVVGNGRLEPGMQVLTKPFAMDTLAKRIKGMVEGL
jgi:PAS domain S-box-containing protein